MLNHREPVLLKFVNLDDSTTEIAPLKRQARREAEDLVLLIFTLKCKAVKIKALKL